MAQSRPPASTFSSAPTLQDIEAVTARAYASLPEALAGFVQNVVIRIEEFPDDETQQELDLESPFDLLGLYRGIALTDQSISDVRSDVDMIYIYRRPILDYWCDTGEDLTDIVRHVLIHEIGHHFGFSDDDMDRLEAEAEATERAPLS
ncbi:MAG: metallopeptidase family protein [Rhodospirillaceae bacterium]|nr:metallopeptidase family protein [Rhodospirillaceae bacterium]